MSSQFGFWIWGTIIAQLLSAVSHSLSFIAKQKPRNETEKQLIDITNNYKSDLGAGFKRSFWQLFIGVSACFTMIYLFGAALNWYLVKSHISPELWKGILLMELIVYGLLFIIMIRFTFLPPIIVTGLVALFLAGAYFFGR